MRYDVYRGYVDLGYFRVFCVLDRNVMCVRECVCIYMCVFVWMYVYVCMCVYMYVCVYVWVYNMYEYVSVSVLYVCMLIIERREVSET